MLMFASIDMFIDSIDYALQGETMGMHKVRIVSLSPKVFNLHQFKAVSKQDGIVESLKKLQWNNICKQDLPFQDFVPTTITSRRQEIEEEERDICSPAKEKMRG
ncbi:hypothetical protein T07_8386 [Trichinella nelsoni]|uniref:Uncharacterized protein n=1 Tax=Trichinella nelsoni TaxID=6336 RepID=A0A0V0S4U7_9BILA|nr:hypothetical protein T07_8386 [Trichinella nelsoni]